LPCARSPIQPARPCLGAIAAVAVTPGRAAIPAAYNPAFKSVALFNATEAGCRASNSVRSASAAFPRAAIPC